MIIIPEIIIKNALDVLMKIYYLDYKNTNQVKIIGTTQLKDGYDWSTNNESFVINGEIITLDQDKSNFNDILIYLNSLLSDPGNNYVRFYNAGAGRVGITTENITDSPVTLTLANPGAGDSALPTLGFDAGTYQGTISKESTLLYCIFGNIEYDEYNYLTEIYKLLLDKFTTKKRELKVYQNFSRIPPHPVMVIITLNNENEAQKQLGTLSSSRLQNNKVIETKFDHYDANYILNIISDNYNELMLIYHFLKAMLRGNLKFLKAKGLHDIKISGVQPSIEVERPNTFMIALQMSFSYDYLVPYGTQTRTDATSVEFQLKKINDQEITN